MNNPLLVLDFDKDGTPIADAKAKQFVLDTIAQAQTTGSQVRLVVSTENVLTTCRLMTATDQIAEGEVEVRLDDHHGTIDLYGKYSDEYLFKIHTQADMERDIFEAWLYRHAKECVEDGEGIPLADRYTAWKQRRTKA